MRLYAATSYLLVALAAGAFAEGLYFVDVTTESGIQLKNTSGNKQRYIVEGMMGGAAFFEPGGKPPHPPQQAGFAERGVSPRPRNGKKPTTTERPAAT